MGNVSVSEKYEQIRQDLKEVLDEKRYHHSLGVAYTAACMAMRYGVDPERAFLAGLLHDRAKFAPDQYIERACAAGIEITETERVSPGLLHAKLAAHIAETVYGIQDQEILSAIRLHTTGKARMTTLEAIIYTADYVEPNRVGLKNLEAIRNAAFKDLDEAVYLTAKTCLSYLEESGRKIDPISMETENYYRSVCEAKKGI